MPAASLSLGLPDHVAVRILPLAMNLREHPARTPGPLIMPMASSMLRSAVDVPRLPTRARDGSS